MEKNNEYRVKDLYLAAFLYSQQKELINIERENQVCWFVFADKTTCEASAEQYWSNRATGKIKAFTDAIRSLKDLIFANK